jgi:hypothetical protein
MIPNINQFTQQLRMMADPVLQRVAMMYKNDPYILPMVVAEDAARKKMRMAARAQMAQPQANVADQAIMAMGEPVQSQQIIGAAGGGLTQLRTPNIERMADGGIAGYADGGDMDFANHSEPVVRMAGGGAVPGYAAGKRVRDFEALIRSEAERQGVDPDIAVRMFMAETGGEADATTAVSSAGAVGLGQLRVAAARDMGLRPEERKDPVKNIQASVGYLKRQLDKYGSYDKALAAYNFGPGNLDKHLQKNKGELNPVGLPKETADYLTKIMPVGTAVAQPKTAAELVKEPAPATAAPAQSGAFGNFGKGLASLADVALSPAAFALKQVGYAASRPFLSPGEAEKFSSEVASPFQDVVGKTFGITQDPAYQQEASRRLANFVGENINKGSSWIAKQLGIAEEDAANMVNTLGVAAPKAVAGARQIPAAGRAAYERIAPTPGKLTPQQIERMAIERAKEKNAPIEAAVETAKREAMGAGATLGEQAYIARMIEKNRGLESPGIAYLRQQQATQPTPGRIAGVVERGGEKTGKQVRAADILSREGEQGAAAEKFTPMPEYDRSRGQGAFLGETVLPKEVKKEALDTAKEGLPKSERKGLSNDDLVEIGLRMMMSPGTKGEGFAGLMKSAGAAGLGALAARREREKTAMEERKLKSEEAYRTLLGEKAGAEAEYYRSLRGPAQAMQIANTAYNNWVKELSPLQRNEMSQETLDSKYQFYIQQAFEKLGLPLPSGVTSQVAGQLPAIPQGVTVRQTGKG